MSSSPQSPQQTKTPTAPISQPPLERLWRTEWLSASVPALLAGAGVLGLFYYWFAVADRYHIFLYNHLDATPFDAITISRYLMAGLVADGAVLVIYTLACWFAGRFAGVWRRTYRPPVWWHVWLCCLPLLLLGIPAITTTVNAPTLPLWLGLACAAVTCAGLALALVPGDLAARRPDQLLWIALAGAGLTPLLILVRAVELPAQGLLTWPAALSLAAGGMAISVLWLAGLALAGRRWRRPLPSAAAILLAAGALTYLLLPLAHHLFFTPPAYRYITSGSNFFAFSPFVQSLCWVLAAALALAAGRLGRVYASTLL